jgi:murein DD-endopeptidase MepM/ murein hydrolase activator NlpD
MLRVRSIRRRMRLRVLLPCALLPLGLWAALPLASQGAGATGSAASVQHKIEVVQGKIGRKRGTEHTLSSDIARWTAQINHLQGRISRLHAREARVQADLDRRRAQLAATQTDLRHQRARLARLRARLIVGRRMLAKRLVELYEADRPDLVTVVLNAKGFADLIERGDFLRRISDQDRQIVTLVRDAKADATATAARLDQLEKRQRSLTAVVLERRNAIASIKQDLIDTRVGYASTRAGKQRALSNVRTEREHLEGALSELKAEQAKIAATLQQAQGVLPAGPIRRGNGTLIWPVNGPITSGFCERRAWEACHPGIDIGVPAGTPIRAAAAGRVALMQSSGASGGYGNFTCIQHSGALSTCYAHQSRFATSLGASVSQGQVIGYTGCTGLCFGDHLHFEVRINGSVVNPLAYL